jgi:CheY-like chemotaxis protein
MSGLEVLESLRDLPHPPKSVVISGYLDEKIEQYLRALPFVQEVMRKPFDLLVFAAVVRRLADAEPKLSGGGQIAAEH